MPDSNITKKALAAAMKSLMAREPFAKISVGEICAECGMNRKSFYYHFRDKYDLVNWVFYTEFAEAVTVGGEDTTDRFLTDACHYFYENRLFYSNALEVEGQNSFSEYFGEVLRPILLAHFSEMFSDRHNDYEHAVFYADFWSDAFLVSLKRWLGGRDPMPPERYLHLLTTLKADIAQRVVENIAR